MVFLEQEFQISLAGRSWLRVSREAAVRGSCSQKAGMGLEEPSWQPHRCWLESLALPQQVPPHEGSLSR